MRSAVIELAQRTGVKVLLREAATVCVGFLHTNLSNRKLKATGPNTIISDSLSIYPNSQDVIW